MKNIRYFIFVTMLIVSFCNINTACAGEIGYMCTVKTEFHLSDDGSLSSYRNPLALGGQFAVDRQTGTLIEKGPSFFVSANSIINVLSHGNSESYFVATYALPATDQGIFYTVLAVQEFADGKEKPFLMSSGGSVYAGTCD